MISQPRLLITLVCAGVLSACSSNYKDVKYDGSKGFDEKRTAPENWASSSSSQDNAYIDSANLDLVSQFKDANLDKLVKQALAQNFALKSRFFNLEIQRLQALNSGSDLWPSLSANLTSRKNETASEVFSSTSTASLELKYEIDLWQKLSASKRQVNLQYLAELANYEQAQRQLVSDVVLAWLDVKEAHTITNLYSQRVANSKQNLDIIERGYKSGLNQALDVYLARNELNSEQSRLAQQEAKRKQLIRSLESLVGQYPMGQLLAAGSGPSSEIKDALPDTQLQTNLVIPAQLVKQNSALKSAWYQLFSADANVAFSHKQRFPSFTLSASLSDSSESLKDLFSDGLGWSLLGNITAPIFNAGKLKNNEKIAQQRLFQSEQTYLTTLYQTFETIENALTQQQTLTKQYALTQSAEQNALAAARLAFEQYQNGLVSYTTVLDSQGRAYDAQSSRIQLKKQLLANQIQLQLALGNTMSSELTTALKDENN